MHFINAAFYVFQYPYHSIPKTTLLQCVMSVLSSTKGSQRSDRYEDGELFKSIDLQFFEDENDHAVPVPEKESSNFASVPSISILKSSIDLVGSAAYDDDFDTDSEDSYDDSSNSSFTDDEGGRIDTRSSLRIQGLGLPSRDEEFEAQLTDVSPMTSSDEDITTETSKQQTNSVAFPRSLRRRTHRTDTNFSASKLSTRSVVSSSRLLSPTEDGTDISKILEHVLALDDKDDEVSIAQGSCRARSSGSARKNQNKNLSMSPFLARETDRENKRLLSKLKKPHRKPLYPGAQGHVTKQRTTSAGINRSKQFEKIDEENGKILQRLERIKSSKFLSRDNLDSQHRDFVKYALNCSKSKNIAGLTDYPCSSVKLYSKPKSYTAWD